MVHIDYAPSKNCNNPDTWGMICVKCGECGRKFDETGRCLNIEKHLCIEQHKAESEAQDE